MPLTCHRGLQSIVVQILGGVMTISDNPKTVKNSFTVLKVAYIIQVSRQSSSAMPQLPKPELTLLFRRLSVLCSS